MRITQNKFGIPLRKYYFTEPDHPTWWDILSPTAYMDCYSNQKPRFFRVENRHTLLTDLTRTPDAIFQSFPKDTRSQIRRCGQEQHFQLNLAGNLAQCRDIYNRFADQRGLSHFTPEDTARIGAGNFCLLTMDKGTQAVICHFYLLSPPTGVANLLISASDPQYAGDAEMRKLIGHANRYLHWQGMNYLKMQGFHTYDWGGYVPDTADPVMQGINRFKRTFNGAQVPIYNYYSPAYAAIEQLRQRLKKH